jgi:hypothetical protein
MTRIALAACLLLAIPARADPPPCENDPRPGWTTCPDARLMLRQAEAADTLDALAAERLRAETAEARAKRLDAELVAARVPVPCPPAPSVVLPVAGGFVAGVVAVLLVVWAAR